MEPQKHIPFVIQGDFSKEFLESMGYKPFVPELVEINKDPVMPTLHIVEGLFPRAKGFDTSSEL